MMPAAVWLAFAVTAMVGIFVACVLVVAAGVRVLEGVLARRRRNPAA
jgi:heme exporter protein D